jgi:diguanylate cyclase (GGDEF)-like protein
MLARRREVSYADRGGFAAETGRVKEPDDEGLLRLEVQRLQAALAEANGRIAELEARADVDALLDILNRRGFERELARATALVGRYGTPAALMFIDLDGFKPINDRHGHAAGDRLLKQVAAELTAHVRASDIVGRLGGDEFRVIMWHVAPALAAAKAIELETLVERVKVAHGGAELSVGASAGIVPLAAQMRPSGLIDAADRAMYVRKRERRGE